eukprot:CAMPEP_0202782646 /NCGR_PEP_ID=MMETSP1388-20130828/63002_1 /ASSEMBLY_ACC=CAM_ASM_000864 /TAXON_ID=37098 /ORGANISM="Isochrysis sp, Strain CCMP1244" /LENGTH=172 /DNA_ID=CAMNT_0049452095 /DNA_START=9 /DNA_END=523 /DNA_ORIENTATION=+
MPGMQMPEDPTLAALSGMLMMMILMMCLRMTLMQYIGGFIYSMCDCLCGCFSRGVASAKERMVRSDHGCVRWVGERLPEPEPEPPEEFHMYAEVFLREVTPDSALGLVGVLPSDTLSDLAERVGGLLEPPPPEELSLYVARWPPLAGGTPLFPLLPAMSAGKGKGKGGDGAA